VDLYFGPTAPAGKDSNWVPTRAGAQFELLFRIYGPDKAFFDKKWQFEVLVSARPAFEHS
jgi:hypothetical protein